MSSLVKLLFLSFVWVGCTTQQSIRPHIVLIIADDLGYADVGSYGSTFYETPNIDLLVRDGVKFTNGYAASPVCSPARAAIQTGKYPVNVNLTDWLPGRNRPNERNRLLTVQDADHLAVEETTLAEVLGEHAYTTFFAGKWHLGATEAFWPEHQGYDTNIAGWKKGMPTTKQQDPNCNGFFSPYCNPRLPDGPEGEYLPERLTDEVIRFIDEQKQDPFFICLPYFLVHIPLQAKENLVAKYESKAKKLGLDTMSAVSSNEDWMFNNSGLPETYLERTLQSHVTYAAMVEALDSSIGKIIGKLKAKGYYENSLIIFTSDNGGLSTSEGAPTSNLPLRAGKGWLNEGGIRVPFVVKYPYPDGKFNQMESDIKVSGIDIMPTILSQARIDYPLDNIDGIDITTFLSSGNKPKRPLFWHYPHYSNQGGNPGSIIIEGDFKLIDDFEKQKLELYHLEEDMGERKDLSDEMPEKTQKLYDKLIKWRAETGAKMMKENPDWNGEG